MPKKRIDPLTAKQKAKKKSKSLKANSRKTEQKAQKKLDLRKTGQKAKQKADPQKANAKTKPQPQYTADGLDGLGMRVLDKILATHAWTEKKGLPTFAILASAFE